MSKEIQRSRVIRELLNRRVKNYEFARMNVLSHTKVLSDIREIYGNRLHKERIYKPDRKGVLKATGVFEYWLTPERKTVTNAMKFERSNFMIDKISKLRGSK